MEKEGKSSVKHVSDCIRWASTVGEKDFRSVLTVVKRVTIGVPLYEISRDKIMRKMGTLGKTIRVFLGPFSHS